MRLVGIHTLLTLTTHTHTHTHTHTLMNFYTHTHSLTHTHTPTHSQENHQRVILEEKRRKREEARRVAAEKKAAKAAAAAAAGGAEPHPLPEEEGEGCIIDNLLKEIRSGTTLRPTQRRGTQRAPQLSGKDLERLKKITASVVDSSTHQSAEEMKGAGSGVGGAASEVGVSSGGAQATAGGDAVDKPHSKPHPPVEATVPVVNGNEPTLETVPKATTVVNGNQPTHEVSSGHQQQQQSVANGDQPLVGDAVTVANGLPSQDILAKTTVVNGNASECVAKETAKDSPSPDTIVAMETPVSNGNEPSLEVAPSAGSGELEPQVLAAAVDGVGKVAGEEREGEREGDESERPLSPLERRLRASCSPERDGGEQVGDTDTHTHTHTNLHTHTLAHTHTCTQTCTRTHTHTHTTHSGCGSTSSRHTQLLKCGARHCSGVVPSNACHTSS